MDDHVETLRRYNRWRRGQDCEEMQDPRVVGDAIDAACDKIDRLRAELTELRKPDCRTCAYIRTDNGDFDCGRFWIDRDFCVNGNKYKATIYPLRLYEKEGKV